jgi:hypothetical protein
MTEMPQGHKGHWDGDNKMNYVGVELPSDVLSKRWSKIGVFQDVVFYESKTKDKFISVSNNLVITQLTTIHFKIDCCSEDALQTSMVKTLDDKQAMSKTKNLYLSLVENGYTLVCDYDQYTGAIAMWKSIGHSEYYKYIYDEAKDTIITAKNFDSDKLWSFGNASKRYTLLVISKKQLKQKDTAVVAEKVLTIRSLLGM